MLERLKAKGERGDRVRCYDGISDIVDMNLSKLKEIMEGSGA